MSKELIIAINSGDIVAVERLLNAGADINFVPDESLEKLQRNDLWVKPPLFIAVYKRDIVMLKFLYNYQYPNSNTDKKVNVNIVSAGFNLLSCLLIAEKNHETAQVIAGFLLSINVSFYFSDYFSPIPTLHTFQKENIELQKMFLYEALFRGDVNGYKEIIKNKQIPIDVAGLKDYLQKYPRRKPSVQQQELIVLALNKLENLQKFTSEQVDKFADVFENPAMYTGTQEEYPKCLKVYLANKEKVLPESLESIIADLQYHRGILKEPGTNEVLIRHGEHNDDEVLKYRKNQYGRDKLAEFVGKEFSCRMKAVVELHTKPGVLAAICKAAVHDELPEKFKNLCLQLLFEYESIPANDFRIICATMISTETLIQHQAEVTENAANAIVGALQKEIKELKQEYMQKSTEQMQMLYNQQAQISALTKNVADLNENLGELLKLKKAKCESRTQPTMYLDSKKQHGL